MTNQERAKNLLEKYKEADSVGTKVYWVKASCLYQWKKEELYEHLFHGAGTWGEFLAKLKVPPSSAQQKLRNWEFYVLNHGFKVSELEDYDTSCLYYICKSGATSKTTIKNLMMMSQEIGREEFLAHLKGTEACDHEDTEEVSETVEKCLHCGKRIRQPQ